MRGTFSGAAMPNLVTEYELRVECGSTALFNPWLYLCHYFIVFLPSPLRSLGLWASEGWPLLAVFFGFLQPVSEHREHDDIPALAMMIMMSSSRSSAAMMVFA